MTSSPRPALLGVCGSLQAASSNLELLHLAGRMSAIDLRVFDGIRDLPWFDPDLDGDRIPAVMAWRAAVADAAGVVIATPEYAHSIPGGLKNALDWLVGTGELYDKAVVVMSAGTTGGTSVLGVVAQTLGAQGVRLVASVSVPGVRTKVDGTGAITDQATLDDVRASMTVLGEAVV